MGKRIFILETPAARGAVRRDRNALHRPACALLALLPMACALAGAAIDERARLGYSNWLASCRSAGLSLSSFLEFTFTLLPNAVIGLLSGGLVLQLAGVLLRRRGGAARISLAAHGGCALGMAGGLLLCTLPVDLPWMLGAEALLAMVGALWLLRPARRASTSASVSPPTHPLASAQ